MTTSYRPQHEVIDDGLLGALPDRDSAARSIRSGALTALVVFSLAVTLLAGVQWHELLNTLEGGKSFCSVSDVLNCAFVWESAFAKTVQRVTRVPVAGWGLVWGLTALFTSINLGVRARRRGRIASALSAVQLTALVGLFVAVLLAVVSARLGVYCLTCIGTYLLVLTFSVFGFRLREARAPREIDLLGGAAVAIGAAFFAYLLVLYPASQTPLERVHAIGQVASESRDPLADHLASLPDSVKRSVREALEEYQRAPSVENTRRPRQRFGPESAPVQILELSDIRCVHCQAFAEVLHELEKNAPPGSFAIELRQFPLDGRCNHEVAKEMVDESGARCAAAEALICLEGNAGFREAQDAMFSEQTSLSRDRVVELAASKGHLEPASLRSCMASKETASKLKDDIAVALVYALEGTPLIVVNGKSAPNLPAFIYGLILSRGDVRAPGWRVLGATK